MASRRTAPLNGHEVSREDVVDLANHITLPPNLPTSEEDQPAVIEQNMIHLAQAAITSMDATSSQAWSRVSDMLLKLNSIKKMREYDYSVLGRELSRMRRDVLKPLPPLDAAPEFAPPPQSRISQDATEIPSLTPTNKLKGDLIVVLAGVEKWVKVNLGPWTEQTLLSPDTQAFNKLANLIRDYWLLAESAYARNPLESSLALLTILELWSEQMCRLDLVEKYIRSRTENSQQQGSGIFVTPTQECFSICYFNSSSQLQALCRKILRIDQEKRQEKAEAQAMKIEIYEDALPRDEIAIPKSFAAWRDSTWLIIHGAGRSAYKSALTKNISIGIWDYKPLQRFGKPVENHRVTLASSTKPFLDGQSRSVCFPVDFGRVCVLNSLQYDTWDRTGRCWPSHIAEPPSLKERCTLSLPSGPYFKLDWASKTSQHTTNEVMSNQYLCDKSLKIQEHIAFCNLRAGERLQSLNILRELGSNNLNQNDPAVTVLVQQAIWEAGSPSQDCFRNAHVCTARDLYGWVERAIHVHEIASLIRDWPATLPVTTDLVTVVKEWQEVYGYHGTFVTTSLQEVVDLKLSSHWGSLYDLCRSANRETGTYALMFTFCSIAFGVDKKQMSLLRTMLAFAFNDVFRTIDPPKVHNAYNLIHGTTISREVISSAIRIEVPRPKKARSNCLPTTKARYARIQHEYDTEIPRLLDLIWSRRSDQRIRVPRDEHFGYLADYTSTIIKECERVIAECQKNKLFIEHIQAVEAELKKMTARSIQQQMPNAHLRIPHVRHRVNLSLSMPQLLQDDTRANSRRNI
ncbi:unnamed protein product [Aureobasidium pullulans]|nr:unnamed protein product [Aureobasidium pullulans]